MVGLTYGDAGRQDGSRVPTGTLHAALDELVQRLIIEILHPTQRQIKHDTHLKRSRFLMMAMVFGSSSRNVLRSTTCKEKDKEKDNTQGRRRR